jgi:hypothetical protein
MDDADADDGQHFPHKLGDLCGLIGILGVCADKGRTKA